MALDIADVTLPEDEIDDSSMDELIKDQHEIDIEVAHSGIDINAVERESPVPRGRDEDLIKGVGMGRFDVDETDEEMDNLREAIHKANDGELNPGFKPTGETHSNAVESALVSGVNHGGRTIEKNNDVEWGALTAEEQALQLTKEIRNDLELDAKTKAFAKANRNRPPEKIEELAYDNIYGVVKNYCDAINPSNEIEKDTIAVVCDQVSKLCGTLARIRV